MDPKLYQISFGMANEACLISDFLAHMPASGSECRRYSRRPEEQHQLQVFWYPHGASCSFPAPTWVSSQQKVACFLDESDWSGYLEMINLAQFWTPVTGISGETILSVWEQPFAVGQLSKGVCRYRYDCAGNPCGAGDEGDPISRAFVSGLPECFQLRDDHDRYGIGIHWVLPLAEPATGSCAGVLEFVSITVPSFEIRRLFTQSFLDSESKRYERFCEGMVGTSFGDDHFFDNQNISGTDNFWETLNALSYGPLGNANENMRMLPHDDQNHVNFANMFADDELLSFIDPKIWGNIVEDEQVTQDNYLEGTNSHQIEETFGMVQQLSLENSATRLITSTAAPATSRKGKRVMMTCDQLRGYFGRRQKDVANELGVHISTIKRWCRSCGIQKWPSSKKQNKGAKSKGTDRPHCMSVKATHGTCIVKFKIDSTIGLECLRKKLGERFELEVGSFRIEYEDENAEMIMIPCTEDLKGRLDFLISSNEKTMHLMVSQTN